MGFAENLQFLRQKKGYTQEQIAEQLQVSRQSVSKWESGGSFPEMDKLLQLRAVPVQHGCARAGGCKSLICGRT